MLIPIVDENDNPIATREREDLQSTDMYRVSALWLLNQRGEVLLAQRALTKKNKPGCWGCSAAGTVESDETYESNILKEAHEELGIRLMPNDLALGPKLRLNGRNDHFCQYFVANTKQVEFAIDQNEVSAVRWMTVADLISGINSDPNSYSLVLEECLFLKN